MAEPELWIELKLYKDSDTYEVQMQPAFSAGDHLAIAAKLERIAEAVRLGNHEKHVKDKPIARVAPVPEPKEEAEEKSTVRAKGRR